jgi:hypothetical protein
MSIFPIFNKTISDVSYSLTISKTFKLVEQLKQITPFSDLRLDAQCAYCGSFPESRDHVPSKILLDEPFPYNLPVVPSCNNCNNGFSKDETYFACAI